MIGVEVGQAASRLFDALEKLGTSTGSGMQSAGPGAQPSNELVKAFEEMLNAAQSGGMEGMQPGGQNPEAGADTQNLAVDGVAEAPGPAERVPGMDFQVEPADQVSDGNMASGHVNNSGTVNGAEQVDSTGRPQQVAATDTAQDISKSVPDSKPLDMKVESSSASHAVEAPQASASSQNPEALIKELGQLMGNMAQNGGLSQLELFRVQYLVGILKVQSSGGMKASQSVSQGMESLLKQKG